LMLIDIEKMLASFHFDDIQNFHQQYSIPYHWDLPICKIFVLDWEKWGFLLCYLISAGKWTLLLRNLSPWPLDDKLKWSIGGPGALSSKFHAELLRK
jgi:hypothetical protein